MKKMKSFLAILMVPANCFVKNSVIITRILNVEKIAAFFKKAAILFA